MSSTLSPLDGMQVLRDVHDVTNHSLRVDAEITATIGAIDVNVTHVDDSIRIGDGTDIMAVNADGSINTVPSDGLTNANSITWKRMQAAPDLVKTFTWADFGLSTERVTNIAYTSTTTGGGHTVNKVFAYTLVTGKYRLDTITLTFT